MNFLPYKNIYIISPLKPEDIQAALEKVVAPTISAKANWKYAVISEGYFLGYSFKGSFKFQQVLTYKNSFAPIIIGSTESYETGSRIHIEMKLLSFVKVFLIFAFGFLTIATASLLYSNIKDKHILPSSFIPLGMIVIVYLMTILGFNAESRNAQNYLLDLFESD